MKIALLGYGKMGRLIAELAVRQGIEVGPVLDSASNPAGRGISPDAMRGVDVALDFSAPGAVLPNVKAAAGIGLNIVVGTTGWYGAMEEVRGLVEQSGIGMVYGSNFSLGVNLFFKLAAHAATALGRFEHYHPYLEEHHHSAKKDAPSGTALMLKELIQHSYPDLDLSIASTRAGFIPGTHVVGFDSEADTILLEHRARSRQGFADGAIFAAGWIAGKQGFYGFQQVFSEMLDS